MKAYTELLSYHTMYFYYTAFTVQIVYTVLYNSYSLIMWHMHVHLSAHRPTLLIKSFYINKVEINNKF